MRFTTCVANQKAHISLLKVDRQKSGDIDFSDFLHMMGEQVCECGPCPTVLRCSHHQNASVDDEVKIAFRLFDKDADGSCIH